MPSAAPRFVSAASQVEARIVLLGVQPKLTQEPPRCARSKCTTSPFVRRLDNCDLAGIERHFLELDMVSRNHRFHSGFGDAAISAYVGGLDVTTDILFGAIDETGGRIVGLAEAHPTSAPSTVEVGTSVLASHRGRGLGRKLVA